MSDYALALDIGTSAIHCLLVDDQGFPVAGADAPLRHIAPLKELPLARAFQPDQLMSTLASLVRKTLAQAGISGRQVAAVGIASQRQGMVLLDQAGQELYCGPNIDLRAVFEGAVLNSAAGAEIYQVTGHNSLMLLAPARLNWLRNHQPDLLDRASTLLSIGGWLAYRLTGQRFDEAGLVSELGLLELNSRQHATNLLQMLETPPGLLPPLVKAGQALGSLDQCLAAEWGLAAGALVTLAGTDTHCGLLGMGLSQAGQAALVAGWSGSLQLLTSTPILDITQQRSWAGLYATGELYTLEANLGDVGNAYRWLTQTLAGGVSYQAAAEMLAQIPPGSDGVVAFLGAGPMAAPSAGLRMGGIFFPTPLAYQEVLPGQMLRAYLESLAYSVKANLEILIEVARSQPACLCLGGGLSRSDVLSSTLSSVLGAPVYRSQQPQISSLGAAMAALTAAGRFSSLEHAVSSLRPQWDVFEPDPALSAEYQDYYHNWRELYCQLAPQPLSVT